MGAHLKYLSSFLLPAHSLRFSLQVRNYRKDWNLQVTQPVAGNYYPVSESSHKQTNRVLSLIGRLPVTSQQLVLLVKYFCNGQNHW